MVRHIGATVSQFTPSLNLDFMKGVLPAGLNFTRATQGTYFDSTGTLQTAPVNTPRFDYDPVTLQPRGILIEEQRTNLLLYSGDISNAAWRKERVTVLANQPGPFGQSAQKLVGDNLTGTRLAINRLISAQAGETYTFSAYLKAGEKTKATLFLNSVNFTSPFPSSGSLIDLTTGQIGGNATGTTVRPVGNGWYRVIATGTTSQATTFDCTISLDSPNNSSGDGVSGIYIWGCQLEFGPFASSYIPTTTTAVTRSADFCTMNVGSWFNGYEGTFYSEATTQATTGFPGVFVASAGSTGNSMGVFFTASTTLVTPFFKVSVNGSSSTIPPSGNLPIGTFLKMGSAYNSTTGFLVRNGGPVVSQSITLPSQALTSVKIGAFDAPLNGWIRKLNYYPRRLTNTYLQALTA